MDVDAVVIAGKVHRRVLRQSQTYMTSAGEVVVERTLYKDRKDEDGRCVSPMELALDIIGDFWTPRAAQQALWVVTHDDAEVTVLANVIAFKPLPAPKKQRATAVSVKVVVAFR